MDTFDRVALLLVIVMISVIGWATISARQADFECRMKKCAETLTTLRPQDRCLCVQEAK
jgi:hypothetical protein